MKEGCNALLSPAVLFRLVQSRYWHWVLKSLCSQEVDFWKMCVNPREAPHCMGWDRTVSGHWSVSVKRLDSEAEPDVAVHVVSAGWVEVLSRSGVPCPPLFLSLVCSAQSRSHLKVSRPKPGEAVESRGTGMGVGDACDTHCPWSAGGYGGHLGTVLRMKCWELWVLLPLFSFGCLFFQQINRSCLLMINAFSWNSGSHQVLS